MVLNLLAALPYSHVRIIVLPVQFPKTDFVFPVGIHFVYLHDNTSEKNTQGVNKGRKSAVSIICWLFPLCFDSRVSALRQIFRRRLIDKKVAEISAASG